MDIICVFLSRGIIITREYRDIGGVELGTMTDEGESDIRCHVNLHIYLYIFALRLRTVKP
jgi:hypothetical protein